MPDNLDLGLLATAALQKAFKDELKAAFAAFCLGLASGETTNTAALAFAKRLTNTHIAYARSQILIKAEFTHDS